MLVFLSYAREDGDLAERIRRTLVAAGFDCFLDTTSLPAGQEYNARIGQAIARADLLVFLVSAAALEPGSYALTELAFAERKWRNPAGYVLPVASDSLDLGTLPAYLRPINVLRPRGNVEAEVRPTKGLLRHRKLSVARLSGRDRLGLRHRTTPARFRARSTRIGLTRAKQSTRR